MIKFAFINRRSQRVKLMQELFQAQREEFTEDNLPTHVVTFLEDALNALPEEARVFNMQALTNAAFHNWCRRKE